MFYHFDVDKWIIHLLPPVLRRRTVYAFLRALLYPVKQLQTAFLAYKDGIDAQLSYNSFQDYLERFLNGFFFFEYNAIYITEEVDERAYLSLSSEAVDPVYMTYQGADPEVALQLYSFSPNNMSGSFIVHVPAALSEADVATVSNWVNYYRMAGTVFKIEVYE